MQLTEHVVVQASNVALPRHLGGLVLATNRAVLISPRHGALFENNQFSTECRRISPIACIAPNKCTAKIRRHSVYDIFGSARPRSWGVGRGRDDGWSELGVLEHLPVTHFEKCALLILSFVEIERLADGTLLRPD